MNINKYHFPPFVFLYTVPCRQNKKRIESGLKADGKRMGRPIREERRVSRQDGRCHGNVNGTPDGCIFRRRPAGIRNQDN